MCAFQFVDISRRDGHPNLNLIKHNMHIPFGGLEGEG